MANEDREWDGGEPESRGDGDAADDDDDEMTPSEASEPEPSDDDSDDSSRRPRILRARAPWRKGGKGKLRAKRRHTLPPRPIPGQRVTEDGERFTFAGIDDPVARKRERDRLRSRSRALKKKLAEQHPPPPPLPASNIPPDTQHNTNFVSFIGSAILAHPLRCAPVGFITQWLQAACPERWGDNAKERRPNWKSAVSSVLSQYECFEKREAYFTDDREKPANFWYVSSERRAEPSRASEPKARRGCEIKRVERREFEFFERSESIFVPRRTTQACEGRTRRSARS